jgi:sugar-specific transcriptional regulator TrmB
MADPLVLIEKIKLKIKEINSNLDLILKNIEKKKKRANSNCHGMIKKRKNIKI